MGAPGLFSRSDSTGWGGGREGAFQAGKGRSRGVPDVGRGGHPLQEEEGSGPEPLSSPAAASPGAQVQRSSSFPLCSGSSELDAWQGSVATLLRVPARTPSQPSASFPVARRSRARPSPCASVLETSGQAGSWRPWAGCPGGKSSQDPRARSAACAVLGASRHSLDPCPAHLQLNWLPTPPPGRTRLPLGQDQASWQQDPAGAEAVQQRAGVDPSEAPHPLHNLRAVARTCATWGGWDLSQTICWAPCAAAAAGPGSP